MYLTRVVMRPGAETTWLLGSAQRLHAAIAGTWVGGSHLAGPEAAGEKPRHPLWRKDTRNGVTTLHVLADGEPKRKDLIPGEYTIRDYEPAFAKIVDGARFRFKLRANPSRVVTTVDESGLSRKRRVGHVTVAQKESWAVRRLAESGLDAELTLTSTGKDVFRRKDKGSDGTPLSTRSTVTVDWSIFMGTVTVTDSIKALEAIRNGVGRAHSYGCGLLTIAPDR